SPRRLASRLRQPRQLLRADGAVSAWRLLQILFGRFSFEHDYIQKPDFTSTSCLFAAFPDWRLEGEPGIPGKINPGVLRDFRDERVDKGATHRLGIDRGEMRIRQQVAHDARGLAGVDEVVDD